ncbi:hypothetical protein ACFSUJ_35120 [Streptomyces lusitanus]|uniref:hypothetical protein n=1 Tax=Streptomyces lusitanus TaxID=68232 RepID=UPI00362EE2B4
MRPVLKPALSRTWRDTETLQFGTVHRHARVVEQADAPFCSFLGLLDGSRERPALVDAGERLGLGREQTADLLDSLEQAGLLDDAAAGGRHWPATRSRTATCSAPTSPRSLWCTPSPGPGRPS